MNGPAPGMNGPASALALALASGLASVLASAPGRGR